MLVLWNIMNLYHGLDPTPKILKMLYLFIMERTMLSRPYTKNYEL